MPLLSAVVITFNEEQNIARCLNSLKGLADDILVVDSFSTDRTKEICAAQGVRFLSHKWEGYSKTKNFANSHCRHDWILSLDADEELSQQLRASIMELKKKLGAKPPKEALFYKIHRLANYCGHWIRYSGWQSDLKVRLFDKELAHWEGSYVHEVLAFPSGINEIPVLQGFCYHYTARTQEEHLRKIHRYSDLAAQKLLAQGRKTNYLEIALQPVLEFAKKFFLKKGFLDGPMGYIVSRNCAKACFLRYWKLYKLRKGL